MRKLATYKSEANRPENSHVEAVWLLVFYSNRWVFLSSRLSNLTTTLELNVILNT
jgi:hypothetical protein